MRKDLENNLIKRFPWSRNSNILNNYRILCDCGDGWYQIIYNLLSEIEQCYKNCNENIREVSVYQIKEKFGKLVVYGNFKVDEACEIIDSYEEKSIEVCEICGQAGRLHTDKACFKTLCNSCAASNGY